MVSIEKGMKENLSTDYTNYTKKRKELATENTEKKKLLNTEF